MWKEIRVNVTDRTVKRSDFREAYHLLGGRSLVAQFLLDEVEPTCDPLGPENKLLFCTSLFGGTGVSGGNRLSVGSKSPLTGGVKESNSGGMMAYQMSLQGIKMLIIEGIPQNDEWLILHIDAAGSVSLEPAGELAGMNTYGAVSKLTGVYGNDIAVAIIGGAGEKMYKCASIGVNEFKSNNPCRLAARGGLGAVMGAKKIKAIIIERPKDIYQIEYHDEEKFNKGKMEINKKTG